MECSCFLRGIFFLWKLCHAVRRATGTGVCYACMDPILCECACMCIINPTQDVYIYICMNCMNSILCECVYVFIIKTYTGCIYIYAWINIFFCSLFPIVPWTYKLNSCNKELLLQIVISRARAFRTLSNKWHQFRCNCCQMSSYN